MLYDNSPENGSSWLGFEIKYINETRRTHVRVCIYNNVRASIIRVRSIYPECVVRNFFLSITFCT